MREKGLLNIGANFEVGSQSPFDARLKVSTFSDLTDNLETTYPKKNIYRTMCVSVEDENAIYMLIVEPNTIYSAADRRTCWKKVGSDIEEAPKDNNIYGRRNGAWVVTLVLGETAGTAFDGERGKRLEEAITKKVDKVDGKGLSTNDFTTEYKEKLDGLENYDDTNIVNELNNTQEIVTINSDDIKELKKKALAVVNVVAESTATLEKINTLNDVRVYDLIETGTDGVVVGTEANSFALAIDSALASEFVSRTVNCVVNNKTTRDITVTLPSALSGWTIVNGMTFTVLSAGKSGEFNFLFLVEKKTVRILGGVLV